ncbi:s1d (lysyl endopeptidase) subfamily c-terminal domain protein [Colletotrichum musicola]|uniref:S1d (Lysyl endopeptidase) subfamily c-terminal domain protein n=1 Tax=Colletotrichum musicola TaxID=2175873 RepID=A0A8H6INL1_9PEZI|nr:s1d (lysyl endopeptidase) subfamily c-terminal domain protein [Colletotrichum musicola]
MRSFLPLLCLLFQAALALGQAAANVKSIYLFKDVLQSNTTALKTSGFDTLLIFRVGVLANGDLVYYSTGGAGEPVDAPVVSAGVYVGGDALAEKVRSFKTGETDVDRVEVSLVSHDATFQNIRALVGDGSTVLRDGFLALKTAWDLDAFNNDDESVYDVASTVAFAEILGEIGYQYSVAPYTNTAFWTAAKAGIDEAAPGLFDRAYLQVYDGGAGNNPGSWQAALGMKVIPLLWVVNDAKPSQGVTPAQAEARFAGWKDSYDVAGGGYWNEYDIEKMGSSYDEYAGALVSVFG